MNIPSPALVSQSAVRRMPRLAIVLFCAAYVLPGFWGREPWKAADIVSFGVMLDMAQGSSSWWRPTLDGQPVTEPGLLAYWLGALFIQALPGLPAHWAARLPSVLLLCLTLLATWYASYHLARQRVAQPVSFAFGGEAQPADYARALADAALLALLACLGLAQLSHETTPDLARLAAVAGLLCAAAWLAHAPRPGVSLALWGLCLLSLLLSGAPWLAAVLGMGLWLLLCRHQPQARTSYAAAGLLLLVGWAGWQMGLMLPPSTRGLPTPDWASWGRLLVWFTWPVWPLVLWTLWRWRRALGQVHVALPLWVTVVVVVDSLLAAQRDRALLLALPALAALAAFALPTLRRSMAALIDWFTLLFFTVCGVVIWVIWLAMMTGIPAKPAANVARLAPGYEPVFSVGLWLVAAVATLAWLALVAWRVGRHRNAIWKSLVLPAAGSVWCWLLLMTLWLPLLDHARSYGPTAHRLASLVPAGSCVLSDGLSPAQTVGLRYHGGLRLLRVGTEVAATNHCQTLVVAPYAQATLGERVDLSQWTLTTSVNRLNDKRESLLVYQRTSTRAQGTPGLSGL